MADYFTPTAKPIHHAVNNLPLIGKGLTSEVYLWSESQVLKLFFPWRTLDSVEREFSNTQAVHAAGIPAPAAYELIQIEKRHGIVFERVNGVSLLKKSQSRPWEMFKVARQLAELHAWLHSCVAPATLRTQREQINGWIEDARDLLPIEREAACSALKHLPTGNALCHGDFHPENVLITTRGPVIIDWSTASRGHPLGDVARTSWLIQTASLPKETPYYMHLLLKFARSLLHKTYFNHYFRLRSGTSADLGPWLAVQPAAASAWRALSNL